MFNSISIVLLVVALFSLLNHRVLKMPNSIGLMIFGIVLAVLITLSKSVSEGFYTFFCDLVVNANFKDLLFGSLLSFLLFAGAIHVNYELMVKQKKFIISFATVSVLISTVLVGTALYGISSLTGLNFSLVDCLLFGALISPTDPVAALAILSKTGVSKNIKMNIEGESLFNDGVGVIVFSGILLWAKSMGVEGVEESLSLEILYLFLEEVVGGIAYGIFIGFAGFHLLKLSKDSGELQVMLSLAIAASGYAIATMLEVSGPLAMVVAGITVGHKLHLNEVVTGTNKLFNNFWGVLDETLNGILFLLIGLSLHLIDFNSDLAILAVVMVVVVLLSRYISVLVPFSFLHEDKKEKGALVLLTWGGLRGGISLGLAMSLPESQAKDTIILITFVIVAFSIIVQGLSVGKLANRLQPKN